MRKLLAIILILTIILPVVAFSEESLKSVSNEYLKQAISMISEELRSRAKDISTDWILIFECKGVKLYQTGEARIEFKKLYVPVVLVNDLDFEITVSTHDVRCNGWEIDSYPCGTLAHAKKKAEICFCVNDAFVESIDQINSLNFKWWVINSDDIETYFKGEQEEQRFW